MIDFIKIGISDVIDILLVAFLIYQVYKIIKGTPAVNIFLGIIAFYTLWLIVKALDMDLLASILGQVIGVGVLALMILFQPEIRRFLLKMGNQYMQSIKKYAFFRVLMGTKPLSISKQTLDELTQACSRMSDKKTGALIAMKRASELTFIIETGDRIDANINRRLIENIFFKNSPLHDGGMIIANNRIVAARCTFPISEKQLDPGYGMRHRAAVGLSEETDAFVIVVSEETGGISVMVDGDIKGINSVTELRLTIEGAFKREP